MTGAGSPISSETRDQLLPICDRLCREARAQSVSIIDRSGHTLIQRGEANDVDGDALATLVTVCAETGDGLARLLGEEGFQHSVLTCNSRALLFASLGAQHLLVVSYDDTTNLGLVGLKLRAHRPTLRQLIDGDVPEREESRTTSHQEITEEDIDLFFGEG